MIFTIENGKIMDMKDIDKAMPDGSKAKRELILRASKRGIKNPRDFMILKNEISEEFKIDSLPNYGLRDVYEKLVKDKEIKRGSEIEKLLKKAKMRTLSGVAVVSVLTKEYSCPGECLYCPTEKNMPKSYLSNEPAVMRAILADFDPYRQVEIRLRALEQAGHSTEKIELIIMGGSFNALPINYQYEFILRCFEACNNIDYKITNHKSQITNKSQISNNKKESIGGLRKKLDIEQRKNEAAKCRVVGLTLETRPDLIDEKELKKFREMGCTRIEIGVQSIYDDVLKKNHRGHGVDAVIEATKLMKDFGFKVSYHMMPGLYGSSLKKDLEMFKALFDVKLRNSLGPARDKLPKLGSFHPDQLKIYPCVVVRDSELYKLWKNKKYKPYTEAQLYKLLCDIKKIIPPYVRISRLIRDIPEESILAGNKKTNLRQLIANDSQKEGWRCQCIRCREIRDKELAKTGSEKLKLNRIDYKSSGGKEIFIELVDNDYQLYALLRLRVFDTTAIIRELHTYGEVVDIGDFSGEAKQHKGLGRTLVLEAEKIAREEFGLDKISVIAGVGSRNYYRKLGYKLEGTYMKKKL